MWPTRVVLLGGMCLTALTVTGSRPLGQALGAPPSIAGFGPAQPSTAGDGGELRVASTPTLQQCAELCISGSPACIGFTYVSSNTTCTLSGWSPDFALVVASAAVYFPRTRTSDQNTSSVTPAVPYHLVVPTSGVTLRSGPLCDAFKANLQYLLKFPVDDMLYWFRVRNATSNNPNAPPPPGASYGWDNGGPDKPYGLRGSVAGAFLMGAGGAVRWGVTGSPSTVELQQRMKAVVRGIAEAKAADGYIQAFPKNESSRHENPDYVTSWLTHGLLEAAVAGESDALSLLRGHFDWFNAAAILPTFLPPAAQTVPFGVSRTSAEFDHGHKIYLIYQGLIHNTRLALSSVGQQQDVDVAADRYGETWWLEQLAQRNLSAVWLRSLYPHNYEITAVEGYMDLYHITGEPLYLDAVDGFWGMFRDHWLHVGGTVAIKEWMLYPPGSYFLDTTGEFPHGSPTQKNCSLDPAVPDRLRCPKDDPKCRTCGHSTGETCGQVFWVKLNQRLHQLRPLNATYPAEIERTIFNGIISQITPLPAGSDPATVLGIRQFAVMHKVKMVLSNISTCCEGQATRALGQLPEYVASFAPDLATVYINMYTDAVVSLMPLGESKLSLSIETQWPAADAVSIMVTGPSTESTVGVSVMLRIPHWLAMASAEVTVTGAASADSPEHYTGEPGTVIPGHDRYAVEYGPILLACVGGAWDDDLDSMPIHGVSTPLDGGSWLARSDTNGSLVFTVTAGNSAGLRFIPYFSVQSEMFEVYPAFTRSRDRILRK
eukprot:m.284949 g.284949  ORF g.284949 m.284949 type:complete len:770 (+) comp27028_c0_seq1:139-2448(+)